MMQQENDARRNRSTSLRLRLFRQGGSAALANIGGVSVHTPKRRNWRSLEIIIGVTTQHFKGHAFLLYATRQPSVQQRRRRIGMFHNNESCLLTSRSQQSSIVGKGPFHACRTRCRYPKMSFILQHLFYRMEFTVCSKRPAPQVVNLSVGVRIPIPKYLGRQGARSPCRTSEVSGESRQSHSRRSMRGLGLETDNNMPRAKRSSWHEVKVGSK